MHQITSIAGNWKIEQIDSIYQCGSNYSMKKSIRKEDAQVFKFRGKGLLIILKSSLVNYNLLPLTSFSDCKKCQNYKIEEKPKVVSSNLSSGFRKSD
jgi:hypothetical protein